MTSDEKIQAISERIRPHLEEMGLGAFVLAGYLTEPTDSGGEKVHRVVMHGGNGNVALEDGLRAMLKIADCWGQGQL